MKALAPLVVAPLVMMTALAAGAQVAPTGATPAPPGRNQQQPTTRTTPSTADSTFVRKASEANAKEIAMGKIAMDNGHSQAVKQYGKQIVHDHSAANQKLQSIASANDLQLSPPEPDQGRTAQQFRGMHGADFDQAFAQHMVADHEKAIALYQKEMQEGRDPAVQSYARGTLPTLQMHLKNAKQLTGANGAMGSDNGNSTGRSDNSRTRGDMSNSGGMHSHDSGMNQGIDSRPDVEADGMSTGGVPASTGVPASSSSAR